MRWDALRAQLTTTGSTAGGGAGDGGKRGKRRRGKQEAGPHGAAAETEQEREEEEEAEEEPQQMKSAAKQTPKKQKKIRDRSKKKAGRRQQQQREPAEAEGDRADNAAGAAAAAATVAEAAADAGARSEQDEERDGEDPHRRRKRQRVDISAAVRQQQIEQEQEQQEMERQRERPTIGDWSTFHAPRNKNLSEEDRERYVGLDCEMVGVGSGGKRSALARCCLVDFEGQVLYDTLVQPQEYVTDLRTKYSGIEKHHLGKGISLRECQEEVQRIVHDKILVGHALWNDLEALMLSHPRNMTRDTARYPPLMKVRGRGTAAKLRPRALKDLAREILHVSIQTGEHDPSEDARAAMMLYRSMQAEWERSLRLGQKAWRTHVRTARQDVASSKPS